ncbi:uncharacterized protein LOC121871973 [Homarus americanus]|uniref:Uncharacterized protein n=1 Tax=Homarus americanus TaxID=6706 RepID=A0A8J5MUK6_HOMAM|nr:uncharacterized protein LOC121871973 [Homarus americanus]KAG7164181.1 hypothetical protein Hamer_G014317 [Homarus americanus]
MYMSTVLLTTLAALAWAQDAPECHCGMFITAFHNEYLVHLLPPFDLDDCSAMEACNSKCNDEFDALTGGGYLNYSLNNGFTVGQELCLTMLTEYDIDHVEEETVYGYARQCNGPWDYDGGSTFDQLCCWEGRYYEC